MALTRDFKVTVRERLQRDPSFRQALLKEAVNCLLSSDAETGKSLLRDYVNATIGFGELGGLTDKSPKSLMRMLSQNGNPQARNLFEIIGCLQQREGVHLQVQAVKVTHNAA
ncbi:MAG: transcriptional regulator [Acidobacteriia bacterium]|nr:transcriptional regulator [Terriglobia bacterium]MYG02267.1 transcriptional regulator [Terriglobia bacterium]MYK11405.1 transcriptional regulator [Terriglobia bacterium]